MAMTQSNLFSMGVAAVLGCCTLVMGCDASRNAGTSEGARGKVAQDRETAKEPVDTTTVCNTEIFMTHPGEDGPTPAHNQVELVSLAQRDSCLEVVARFSGCPSDELMFTWNGALMKSYPPKLILTPAFTSKGDCEMIREEVYLLNFRSLLRRNGKVTVMFANSERNILME